MAENFPNIGKTAAIDDLSVARALQRFSGHGSPRAAVAVNDDRPGFVGLDFADFPADFVVGNVDGSGNVFITGYTTNLDSTSLIIVAYNTSGTKLWRRYFGTPGSIQD